MSDDIADVPRVTLSDAPLDAAQRIGLARFRLGPDAPPWLTETLAFARDEVNRLTRERDEALAAVAADLHCDECGEVATRHHHEPARKHGGDDCACDAHSAENGDGYWVDLPHAAAVRDAVTP
jgi:hypothetical protein